MKKILIAILCIIFSFSLIACGAELTPSAPNIPDTPAIPSVPETPSMPNIPTEDENTLQITVENYAFTATLYKNETVKEFVKLLPQTFNMGDLNGNEKYYYLPQKLANNPQNMGKIEEGELMLYGSNCVVLFYESFATNYSYTTIGKIVNYKELKKVLGKGSVDVTFSLKLEDINE